MILQGVGHPVPYLEVSYANDPKKGGYMAYAPALDLTTRFEVIYTQRACSSWENLSHSLPPDCTSKCTPCRGWCPPLQKAFCPPQKRDGGVFVPTIVRKPLFCMETKPTKDGRGGSCKTPHGVVLCKTTRSCIGRGLQLPHCSPDLCPPPHPHPYLDDGTIAIEKAHGKARAQSPGKVRADRQRHHRHQLPREAQEERGPAPDTVGLRAPERRAQELAQIQDADKGPAVVRHRGHGEGGRELLDHKGQEGNDQLKAEALAELNGEDLQQRRPGNGVGGGGSGAQCTGGRHEGRRGCSGVLSVVPKRNQHRRYRRRDEGRAGVLPVRGDGEGIGSAGGRQLLGWCCAVQHSAGGSQGAGPGTSGMGKGVGHGSVGL